MEDAFDIGGAKVRVKEDYCENRFFIVGYTFTLLFLGQSTAKRVLALSTGDHLRAKYVA